MRRRRWLPLVAAVGGAVTIALLVPGVLATNKPRLIGEYDGLVWYDSFDVGTKFVAGQVALLNESDVNMTVVEVVPVMARGAQLEFLGAYLAGDDKVAALTDRIVEFPPTEENWGSFVPAAGGVVRPVDELFYFATGAELMLAFSVEGGTRNEMLAIDVVYEVEGVRKKERIDTGFVVCVPETVECLEDE